MRVLGVDLGTSSVKLLVIDGNSSWQHTQAYSREGFEGHFEALLRGLRALSQQIDLRSIDAMGLSGQTGSYAVMAPSGGLGAQIGWQTPGRQALLEGLLETIAPEVYLDQTGMAQPRIASYPLPSLMYLKGELVPGCLVLQPKDYLCYRLSGEALSDPFSWRGLATPSSGEYSKVLLAAIGLEDAILPRLRSLTRLSNEAASLTGLKAGLPIHVGLNDFYASLVGMGVQRPGEAFDVAGTSEHLGVVVEGAQPARLIRSPMPGGLYVHYGVTASSGTALSWSARRFGTADPPMVDKAPLFLPYLKGERAPVFDEDARGMLIGLTDMTDTDAIQYSVYEGVVFSLYSIFEALQTPSPVHIRVTGGPSENAVLNAMKAAMFGLPLLTGPIASGSALGAAVLAGVSRPEGERSTLPDSGLGERLHRRYAVWQRAYGAWLEMVAGEDVSTLF